MYDGKYGRTLSIDPHFKNYPWQSSYSMFADNPILFIDNNGKDIDIYYKQSGKTGHFRYKPGMAVPTSYGVAAAQTVKALNEIHKIDNPSVLPSGYSSSDLTPKALVEDLSKAGYTLKIHAMDYEQWQTDPNLKPEKIAVTNHTDKVGDLYWSSDIGAYEVDATGNKTGLKRSATSILAHELKHVSDAKKKLKKEALPDDTSFPNNYEKNAVVFENIVALNKTRPEGERTEYTDSDYKPTVEIDVNSHNSTKDAKKK